MGAKRIQVSVDDGTTWKTLPGSSGDFREEEATVNDTIFGQTWQSDEVSIGQWQVGANGFYKGVAGYAVKLLQQGTPTTLTDEPMALVAGSTYRITDTTKRLIDYFTATTFEDGGTPIAASDVVSIDYLNGEVTLLAPAAGAVTISGKYVPTAPIAGGRNFTLNQTAAEIDTTTYETAEANDGWRTFKPGLRTANMDVSGLYDVTNGAAAALRGRAPIVVECRPDGTEDTIFRGFFKRHNRGQSGDVGALEEETQTLGLWVPDGALVVRPFGWYFGPNSKINPAIKDILASWQAQSVIKVRYQDDPDVAGSGHVGDAIVTECSLTNSFDGLNEFRFSFRGSGTPAAV